MSRFIPVPPGSIAAVVTHLEMFSPPDRAPVPSRTDMMLASIERPSLDWYQQLYRRIGEEWLWFSRLVMSEEALTETLHHPNVAIYSVQQRCGDRQTEVGLLELDWRQAPECEIAFFGLVPEATASGAGTWLMAEAQHIVFAEEGATRLWLHTCTLDHPRALPFYLRHGFKAFRREVEIAPDPRLTGALPATAAGFHPMIEPPTNS